MHCGGFRRFALMIAMSCLVVVSGQVSIAATADETIELVKAGTKNAASLIKNGKGKVTVSTSTRKNHGGTLQTESVVQMVFLGDKHKFDKEVTYLRNDVPEGMSEDAAKRLLPPGTKLRTVLSSDGEKITMYKPDENSAIEDKLNGPPLSRIVRDLYARQKRTHGVLEGHGVSVIGGTPIHSFVQDKGFRLIGNETINGRDCIVVERTTVTLSREDPVLPLQSGIEEWTIDPVQGFTIPHMRVWYGDADGNKLFLAEERHNEVRDYGNGVWGPAKSTVVRYRLDEDKKSYEDERTVLTYAPDFVLNTDISDKDLAIELPSGTFVTDNVSGEKHIVP